MKRCKRPIILRVAGTWDSSVPIAWRVSRIFNVRQIQYLFTRGYSERIDFEGLLEKKCRQKIEAQITETNTRHMSADRAGWRAEHCRNNIFLGGPTQFSRKKGPDEARPMPSNRMGLPSLVQRPSIGQLEVLQPKRLLRPAFHHGMQIFYGRICAAVVGVRSRGVAPQGPSY